MRLFATNYREYGVFLTFWWGFCVLLILRWKSPNIERYSTDSHSAHTNCVELLVKRPGMYPPLQPPSCATHIHDRPRISDANSFHPLLYTWICILRHALYAHSAAAMRTAWLTGHGSDWVSLHPRVPRGSTCGIHTSLLCQAVPSAVPCPVFLIFRYFLSYTVNSTYTE